MKACKLRLLRSSTKPPPSSVAIPCCSIWIMSLLFRNSKPSAKCCKPFLLISILVPLAFFLIAGALVGLNWKLPHRSLIWIGSSLVSGSAFVIIPAIVALVLKIPQRITVSADYINTALRTLAQHYTTFLLGAGALVFFLGIACLVAYNLISKAKRAGPTAGERAFAAGNGTILIHPQLADALKGAVEKYMKKVIVSLLFAIRVVLSEHNRMLLLQQKMTSSQLWKQLAYHPITCSKQKII